jgi:predicted transcriptional regulator
MNEAYPIDRNHAHPEALTALAGVRRTAEETRRRRVQYILLAREQGATWEEIGNALGITKAGARNFITREEGAA